RAWIGINCVETDDGVRVLRVSPDSPADVAGLLVGDAILEIDGTAVSSGPEGLLPLNQTAQLVTHDLAYHDYEGIALDHDERPRLQRDLGTKNHMLLRNHGTLTVGRSVASAFERMYHLERACSMQVATRTLGPIAYP
ncbi:MAG: class II aldolase/adducin family protein, partial [Bradyrhizobium sp.]